MTGILCALFFLSGAAALLFETLWFRQAGLAFGNSVWASSLVLASFMAGLALGNGLMARFGARVRRPVRFYALLEAAIAVGGVTLVWVLPLLGEWLAPVFRPFLDRPWVLNPLRLGIGFALLLLPATAMGATLPVLVKALLSRDPNFGSVLGRLYGWNTLGAVVGSVAGEVSLVAWFGVRGTAWAAGACNAVVAGVALTLAVRLRSEGEAGIALVPEVSPARAMSALAWRAIAAAFLAGGILLAFEVVWFRFMHLFVHSGSLVFSLMLAVVLTGIAAGGFSGGRWLRRDADADRHTATLALLAGAVSVALYASFAFALAPQANVLLARPSVVLGLSFVLMFPVSLISGVLFTFLGSLVHRDLASETRSAGLLTLANTLGAALGSAIAGFVLLPGLGMEHSFFLVGGAYGIVALLVAKGRAAAFASLRAPARLAAAGCFALAFALFPFGKMDRVYLRISIDRWDGDRRSEIVAVREGRTETSVYLRNAIDDETVNHRLLTDGFAMSGTGALARRYQKLYVYWPVALHSDPKRALVISYGVGSTAKGLVDTRGLDHIDVVDISREILDLSEIVYPDPADHPLRDPRVRVHVEDGRFFLQTTDERYDIITGEPPPPKNAGVVNLYTREYFQLIRDRLAEGGITTYWLPAHNTLESDTRAIIRAFCDVFEDCSLWSGKDLDWMLVGSRDARWSRSESAFTRQWRDPLLAPELSALGLEVPEQIGALFMADAEQLRELVGDAEPLTDDRPKRLSDRRHGPAEARRTYRSWMDTGRNRERFWESAFIAHSWPESLRDRSLPYFDVQRLVDGSAARERVGIAPRLREIHFLQSETPLVTAPLWRMGASSDQVRAVEALVARGARPALYADILARRAAAERDFDRAARILAQIQRPRRTGDGGSAGRSARARAREPRLAPRRCAGARLLEVAGADLRHPEAGEAGEAGPIADAVFKPTTAGPAACAIATS
jgi:predicted membrane-bound spermidine synthase